MSGKAATELLIDGKVIETEHDDLREALGFVFNRFPDAEIVDRICQPAWRVVLGQSKNADEEIGEIHLYSSTEILGFESKFEMARKHFVDANERRRINPT